MATQPQATDEGQDSYLPPDVPPDYVLAPNSATFANATWLPAGPELTRLVLSVLNMEDVPPDFRALASMPWEVRWRRRTAPERNGEPNFATVWVPDARVIWEAEQQDAAFPRWAIDIHWKHFDDLRAQELPAAVHEDLLRRDVHYALLGLAVSDDQISTVKPTEVRAENVKTFGLHGAAVSGLRRAFDFWPDPGE